MDSPRRWPFFGAKNSRGAVPACAYMVIDATRWPCSAAAMLLSWAGVSGARVSTGTWRTPGFMTSSNSSLKARVAPLRPMITSTVPAVMPINQCN
ncbi:hypothetical protein D3C81_1297400 [compost metagenome]